MLSETWWYRHADRQKRGNTRKLTSDALIPLDKDKTDGKLIKNRALDQSHNRSIFRFQQNLSSSVTPAQHGNLNHQWSYLSLLKTPIGQIRKRQV